MKKILYMTSLFFLLEMGLNAQPVPGPGASTDWVVGGNTAVNTRNVIGPWWAPTTGTAPSQMWFTTGAAAPQYRMNIMGGGLADVDGYIGMGNNLGALGGFVPQSRLHLNQTGGTTAMKYTNNAIGSTATDGLSIGIRSNGFAFYQNFEPGMQHAFYTNDGSASGIFERMRINAFSANGFIGMGNSASFTALSQLHINTLGANISGIAQFGEVFRTEGLSTVDNSWRLLTGPALGGSTQKGRLYVSPTGNAHNGPGNAVDQNFNIEATQADMVFWANGTRALGTTPFERMRITSELDPAGANVTRVGITRDPSVVVTDPRAMLHIGEVWNFPGSRAHRKWMDVGTFYHRDKDAFYVGQHWVNSQENDAVLSWGADPANFNVPGGDRMLIRFADDPALGNLASGPNGLEIARMVSDGNNGRMSIGNPLGPIDPGNTLEIISSGASPQPAGLRFRNLNCFSATSPLCNPTSPVYLSVDGNGDVILVNAATSAGCCLGNQCTAPQNALPGDYEIPMDKHNFSFTDPAATLNDGQNFVRIGGSCGIPRAKLDVFRNFTNNSLSTVIGTYLENQDLAMSSPFSGTAYGTYTVANNQNAANYGLYGEAYKASSNIGVAGNVTDTYFGGSNAIQNTALQGFAQDAYYNVGVLGAAFASNPLTQGVFAGQFRASSGPNGVSTYGIYTSTSNNSGAATDNVGTLSYAFNGGTVNNNVGVAGISQNFGSAVNDIGIYGEGGISGYFTGSVMTSMPVIIFSDQKIKNNVQTIENGMDILKKLHPVTYDYNTKEYPELHLGTQKQYGFIAQEVEQVLPELVSESKKPEFKDKDGKIISKGGEFKGVNYDGLIPVLTKSVQEQQGQIEKQQMEIDAQRKEIEELKALIKGSSNDQSTGSNHISNVELTDAKTIILDQNVPNPFAEQTMITYTLTDEVQKAQMLFYNADGKLINSVELTERGKGQLNVFANDLSNGIYTYTLVVDGKIVDTKRMIKNK